MSLKSSLTKYVMAFATVAVIIFFTIATGGKLLYAQNVNNLIAQNAYKIQIKVKESLWNLIKCIKK